jgi:hypothetical protein
MYKSDLILIIETLEKEKILFETEVQNCLQFKDYLGAHHYEIALSNVTDKLLVLYTLENPDNDRIKFLEGLIHDYSKKFIEDPNHPRFASSLSIIGRYQEELDVLKSKKKSFQMDSSILQDLLYQLVHNKINYINFVFQEQNHHYVNIYLDHSDLFLDYHIQTQIKEHFIQNQHSRRLKR